MKSFFQSFTHLVSTSRAKFTPKRDENALKHCSTFFRLIVKTGYVNISKDTHPSTSVSIAHWCRRSTETLPVFGSNPARSTLFSFFKIRETPTYPIVYFSNTLRVIKLILQLSLSQIFFRFKKVFLKEFGEDYKLQLTDKLQKFSINSKFVVEKMNVSKWFLGF